MKELTIEEKAQAYDEALEIAKAWHKLDNNDLTNADLETLFPGLKESEDEKVRKELMDFIYVTCFPAKELKKKERFLDWLEKQGKQNHIEQNLEMVEALRTEYEKGRADAFAQMQKEWSEEDECTLNGILDDYKSMCKTYRNWLESLKNRIQPQQKQEWSEEDEKKQKKNY